MQLRHLLHFLLALSLLFCTSVAVAAEQFNMEDKNMLTNGNLVTAVLKLQDTKPEALEASAQAMPVADITKKIYTSMGKAFKITGKVYKVEEMPPNSDLPGTWTEVLLLAKNPNAPMGITTIDFLYKGDSAHINSRDIITCSGYLAGTFESQNAMGGAVEAISLVGNHFKKGR